MNENKKGIFASKLNRAQILARISELLASKEVRELCFLLDAFDKRNDAFVKRIEKEMM